MIGIKQLTAFTSVAMLVGIELLLVVPARAEEAAIYGRSFDRFQFDAVVNRGLWGEARATYAREEDAGSFGDLDVLSASPRVAYGWRFIEGGVIIPSLYLHSDARSDETGLGDIHFYGKAVPLVLDFFRGGLGVDISVPSGDEDKGLGTGEGGFTPFATAAVHAGPIDVRGHLGYQAFTGGGDAPDDSVVFGAGLFAGFDETVFPRLELNGQDYDRGGSSTALSLQPGIDIRIPVRRIDLWLRANSSAGLTHEAADWGLGAGLGVSWNPAGR